MKLRSTMILAATLLSAPLLMVSQSKAKPELTGVAHVALRVSDVDAEIAFFNKLGFEMPFAHEENGQRAFAFVKVNNQEFIEVHPHTPLGQTAPQPLGFNHICFVTTDANGEYAMWAAAGVNPTAVSKGPDGTLEFGTKDAEGRLTEALQILPGSQPAEDNGKHLGAHRVSDWMVGVEMPVADVAAERKFYESIGFVAAVDGTAVKLSSPGHADVRMVLQPADPNRQARILFKVSDEEKAAAQLRAAGLSVEMQKGRAVVHDPDGNTFVMTQ